MDNSGQIKYEHIVTGVTAKLEEFADKEKQTNSIIAEKNKEIDKLKKSVKNLKKKNSILSVQNTKQIEKLNKSRMKNTNLFKGKNEQTKIIANISEENQKLTLELQQDKQQYEQKLAALKNELKIVKEEAAVYRGHFTELQSGILVTKSTINSITTRTQSETED